MSTLENGLTMSSLESVLGLDFSGSDLRGCETPALRLSDLAEEYCITGRLFRPGFPLNPEEATRWLRKRRNARKFPRLLNDSDPVILEIK